MRGYKTSLVATTVNCSELAPVQVRTFQTIIQLLAVTALLLECQ